MYPNPTTDNLTVANLDSNKMYSYSISDQMGRSLQTGVLEIGKSATIDVSLLRQGLYHISIVSGNQRTEVLRFVVQ